MSHAAELIDRGIRAYTRGQLGEAERCWSEALAAEPANARARSYLDVLLGRKEAARRAESPPPPAPQLVTDEAEGGPVPLPSPNMATREESAPSTPPADAPVPLPAPPPVPSWMRPPMTPVSGLVAEPPAVSVPPARTELAAPPDTVAYEDTVTSRLNGETSPDAATSAPDGDASPQDAVTSPRNRRASPDAGTPPPTLASPAAAQATRDVASSRPAGSTLADYSPSPWDQGPALSPSVVLEEGDGLDLATVADQSDLRSLVPEPCPPRLPRSPAGPRSDVDVWMEGARELFALGDFSGSLEMLEKILRVDPSHEEARQYLTQNEATLIAMYESKLGQPDCVPRLAIKPEEVMWLNLDHRAGFLLAQIDGAVNFEDLFALSGLPRLDTARILASLLQEGVIKST